MSDVTRFPASPEAEQRLREREEAQRIQEGRAREEAARIRERQAKLEHARNACARRPKMVRETERKHVASNLWQLLEYFKNLPDGPRPADVLVAAKCSQNGDSTKRLPRYALRPNGDGKELVQKIEAYVNIARKAAELAKEDPDDAELRVLSGSSYLSNLPEVRPQDPDGEAAEMIAKGLMGIATRLGEKHDLRGYFAQCERQRITPSGSRPGVLPFAVDHNSSFNNLPLDTEVPLDNSIWRCPQAYLGSVVSGAPVHVNAKAALEYDGPLDFDFDTDGEHVDEGLEARFTLELRVKCMPTLDIYVALSPSGPAGSVIPTLIVQPRTRIKPESNSSEGPDRSAIFDDRFTLGEHHGHPSPAVKEHKSRHNLLSLSSDYLQEAVPERELVTPKLASYFYGSRSIFRLQRSWLGWVIKELTVGPGVIPHPVPDSFREPSTTLHVASAQNILHLLTKEMFFRYHESSYLDASPAGWTDERQDEAGDLYFLPSSEATADAKPTMASARTLLSRLERWMRGDLVVPEGADIAPGKLEDELDRRAKALVSAAKAAREEAAERLSTVLVEPAKEPAAGAETKPDPA